MSLQTRFSWSELFWLALRTGVPFATGVLCGLLWTASRCTNWLLVPMMVFFLCFLLALVSLSKPAAHDDPAPAEFWLRAQRLALGMAVLGSVACVVGCALAAQPVMTLLAGLLGAAGGVGAIVLANVRDWGFKEVRRSRNSLVILPWLAALELGLLGRWLIIEAPAVEVVAEAHQRVLCFIVLVIVLELLVVHRYPVPPGLGDIGGRLARRGSPKLPVSLRILLSWVASVVPALLLLLTITNEGIWLAFLACFLLVVSHGMRYHALMDSLNQTRQGE